MDNKLSTIQRAVLDALRGFEPQAVLTGGGALVGYYFGHRETRDLDFFFRDRGTLEDIPVLVEGRLRAAGFDVSSAVVSPAFRRFDVRLGDDVLEVELVADPVAAVTPPGEVEDGIVADSPYEILVNKLNALLGRAAIRDLVDVQVLVNSGLDLNAALKDAGKKDGGFSPPTLAWVLEKLPVRKLALDAGFDPDSLDTWRDTLRDLLLSADAD